MLRIDGRSNVDLRDLKLAQELEIDMLGVSFVGSAEDIRRIRALAPGIPIVAKIDWQGWCRGRCSDLFPCFRCPRWFSCR